MKTKLNAFINWKQNNWVKLLLIAEFIYNNAKNVSIGYTPFELNCGYYPKVLFEKNIDFYSRSCFTDKLVEKLKKLI